MRSAQKRQSILRRLKPWLFLAPVFLLLLIFTFYPFLRTILSSFALTAPNGSFIRFVGIENYRSMFRASDFISTWKITLRFSFFVTLCSTLMGLITAILGNQTFAGAGIFRTLYAMPMAASSACIAIVFGYMLQPNNGFINALLNTNVQWLNKPNTAMIWTIIVTVWLNSALNYIILIAALQGIDRELYESADVDGAGFFLKQRHITLPGLSPALFFLVVVNIIISFQSFGQIHVLTGGGPFKTTSVINYSIYLNAFQNSRFGIAYAQSVLLFLIILIATALQFRLEKKETDQ